MTQISENITQLKNCWREVNRLSAEIFTSFRTLLKKFNILILDEALNQIDIDLERKILKKIFSKFSNKTIIVISHRLDNQDLYNRKLMISNGELIENVSKV